MLDINGIIPLLFHYHSCPWDQFAPTTLPFCEERLCAWVAQPGNSYSCGVFVIVGLWIIWRQRKHFPFLLLGLSSCIVGILSFVYHATNVFWGEFLDLSSMYFFISVVIAINLVLLRKITSQKYFLMVSGIIIVASLTPIFLEKKLGIPIFALNIAAAFGLHLPYLRQHWRRVNIKPLILMWLVFGISFGFWLLDTTRVWCNPQSHWLSGHLVWHFLNGTAIYFYYDYIKQFARDVTVNLNGSSNLPSE